jgi:hypothetical protein
MRRSGDTTRGSAVGAALAGLVFTPALLAVVAAALGGHRVRSTTVAAASLATVGVGFVWVKATFGALFAAGYGLDAEEPYGTIEPDYGSAPLLPLTPSPQPAPSPEASR